MSQIILFEISNFGHSCLPCTILGSGPAVGRGICLGFGLPARSPASRSRAVAKAAMALRRRQVLGIG